jgi:hypothetical protein
MRQKAIGQGPVKKSIGSGSWVSADRQGKNKESDETTISVNSHLDALILDVNIG